MRGVSTSELAAVRVKLNSVKFKCYEIWSNGVKIWPREKYVIVEASVIYTESTMAGSVNYITACADNHATIVGTVEKRNGDTVIETLTDQVLVPDLTGATGFYLDDKEIHAYDLEQTETAMNNPTITCKYVSEDEVPVDSKPFEIEIVQQGNQSSTSDSIVSVGIGSGLQDSNFTINGGSTTFTATKVVNRTTTWTSGHPSTEYGIPINISDNVSYVISSGTEGGSLLGKVFTAQTRVQKESRGNWNIVGTYIYEGATYQPTMTITQDCDTKLSENVYYENFRVSIDVGRVITPINAQGGEVELNAGGMYDRIQTTTWQSDPLSPVVNPARDIPSYPTITEAGSSRFHRNGARVTHDNMTTNKTTDNVTYTATLVVDGVSRKTDTLSLSATNGEKATREAISSFQVGISNSSFGVYGGEGTLSARTISTIYSILDSSTSSVTYEIIKSTGNVTIVTSDTTFSISPSSSGAYIEGLTLRVASRVENDEAGSWMVTGVWNGWSDGEPVSQEADTYELEYNDIDYWVNIGVYGHQGESVVEISAQAGSYTLVPTGGHNHQVKKTWTYGGTYFYDNQVQDTPTISGSASYFSRNGRYVTHENMGIRWNYILGYGYDSVTYTATNNDVTSSVKLEAYNYRTPLPDVTTGFHINNPSKVTSRGTTITIQGTRTYKTERYIFSSLSQIDGTPTSAIVDANSVSFISLPYWIPSVSGASVEISLNGDNQPERSTSFGATYTDPITHEDFTDNDGTITQWEGTTTSTEYRCTSLSVNSSSVSATSYGSGSKVGISYSFQKKVTTKTDGVTTEGSWGAITSSDQQTMYLSGTYASHFTLYNGTTGSSGQGVIVHGGDSMYIYPVSANTDSYPKTVKVSESTGTETDDFTHDAVQRQTITITCGYSESASGKVIPYVRASASVHSNISVSFEIVHGNSRSPLTYYGILTIINGTTLSTGSETQITAANVIRCRVKLVSPTSDTQADYVF